MTSSPTAQAAAREKAAEKGGLKTAEYVGYALGDTASNLFFQSFAIFLTYFYTDVWGLAPAAIGAMFLVIRLFDAAADPLIGLLADRTQTRWGKFRPYLLWFAIPYGLGGYLLFASPDLDAQGKLVYAYLTYGLMMLAYSFINVPYSSMLGVISPSPQIRTLASSYRFVGAFVGMARQDLAGTLRPADFDFFEYRERNYCANPFSAG